MMISACAVAGSDELDTHAQNQVNDDPIVECNLSFVDPTDPNAVATLHGLYQLSLCKEGQSISQLRATYGAPGGEITEVSSTAMPKPIDATAIPGFGPPGTESLGSQINQTPADPKVASGRWRFQDVNFSIDRFFSLTPVRVNNDTQIFVSLNGVFNSPIIDLNSEKDRYNYKSVSTNLNSLQTFTRSEGNWGTDHLYAPLNYRRAWENAGPLNKLVYDNALIPLKRAVGETSLEFCTSDPILGSAAQIAEPRGPASSGIVSTVAEVLTFHDATILTVLASEQRGLEKFKEYRGAALTQSGCIMGIVADVINRSTPSNYAVYAVRPQSITGLTDVIPRGHQNNLPITIR